MGHLTAALKLPVVLVRSRELLGAFVNRELKSRIEGSILGRVWPLAQPLILFAIYYLIFSKILKIGFTDKLAPHGPEGKDWRDTFYLVTGILPWTVLADSLSRGTGVVLENANLIKKIAFPSELLPVYQVVVYHVYFVIGFVLLVGLELAANGSLPAALAWFPILLLAQALFVSGLTMFLSAANVFVRDVMQAVPMFLIFWMFTTPVFYDPGALMERALMEADPAKIATAQKVLDAMSLNPMATLLDLYRAIFSYGHIPFPVGKLGTLLAVSVVVQLLGYAYFLRSKGRFADEV